MKLEKLKTFLRKRPTSISEQEMIAHHEKVRQEAQSIRALHGTRGWKVLQEFFEAKKKVINQELRFYDPYKEPEKIVRCQEKHKIIDELYNFMNSKVQQDIESFDN